MHRFLSITDKPGRRRRLGVVAIPRGMAGRLGPATATAFTPRCTCAP
jgi:hypothetical protein